MKRQIEWVSSISKVRTFYTTPSGWRNSRSNELKCKPQLWAVWDPISRRRHFGTTSKSDSTINRPPKSSTSKTIRTLRKNPIGNNHHGRQTDRDPEKLSRATNIKNLEQELQKLRHQQWELPALPSLWSSRNFSMSILPPSRKLPDQIDPKYVDLVKSARAFVQQILEAMGTSDDNGKNSKSGKIIHQKYQNFDTRYTHQVTFFLQQSLYFFRTSYNDCRKILALARHWNLNLPNIHFALEAACREERWEEAANLFSHQIDPDRGGYLPMDIDVRWPLGLYIIAKDAEKRKCSIVEHVMDAVMSMCMVNPMDQDKYVLAAGTVIGQMGVWEELLEYQRRSFNSSRLGQALVAATMHACMMNGKSQMAWAQYSTLTDGIGSVRIEWQWSGGADIIDPVVRDIAMRAAGPESLILFRQAREEEFQVSVQAVLGVIQSCTCLDDVLEVVNNLCDGSSSWLVDGDLLSISNDIRMKEKQNADYNRLCLEFLVIQIMQYCNKTQEFAVGLQVFDSLLNDDTDSISAMDWAQVVIPIFSKLSHKDSMLAELMTSQKALGMDAIAAALYESLAKDNVDSFPLSRIVYSNPHSIQPQIENWLTVQDIIHSLKRQVYQSSTSSLTRDQTIDLLSVLAKVAQAANDTDQPRATVFIVKSYLKKISRLQKPELTVENTVRSILGMGREDVSEYVMLKKHDHLLAEFLRAFRLQCETNHAKSLSENVIQDGDISLDDFPLTAHEVLSTKVELGQLSEALALFYSLAPTTWTPTMFTTLAKAMEKEKFWNGIFDLYSRSLKAGCLSEALGISAMKAIAESQHYDAKMQLLRAIVKKLCALSQLTEVKWIELNYWKLKQILGSRYSRLLMHWNDQKTSHIFEFQLAIQQFYESESSGLALNYEVECALVEHCRNYDDISELATELGIVLPIERDQANNIVSKLAATTVHNETNVKEIDNVLESNVTEVTS